MEPKRSHLSYLISWVWKNNDQIFIMFATYIYNDVGGYQLLYLRMRNAWKMMNPSASHCTPTCATFLYVLHSVQKQIKLYMMTSFLTAAIGFFLIVHQAIDCMCEKYCGRATNKWIGMMNMVEIESMFVCFIYLSFSSFLSLSSKWYIHFMFKYITDH